MVRSAAALAMVLLLPVSASAQAADARPKTHVVQEGNTLWGLAQTFYGDAYEWTRIFEANRDRIVDPEMLPTGLELVIPSRGTAGVNGIAVLRPGSETSMPSAGDAGNRPSPVAAWAEAEDQAARTSGPLLPHEETPPEGDLRRRGAGPPVYVDGAFYRAPWLVPHGSEPASPGTIVEFDDLDRGGRSVQPFDRVRIAMVGSLPPVGSRLQAFRTEGSAGGIGRVVRPTGTLTVVEVASTGVLAEASDLYARMSVGDGVRPLPVPPVTLDQASRPVTDGLRARVIGLAESRPLRVPGDYLFLETGTNGGVRAGDVLEVVPTDEALGDLGGTVQIVSVYDEYATARITRLENPLLGIGVELRLSRRMQ